VRGRNIDSNNFEEVGTGFVDLAKSRERTSLRNMIEKEKGP
jgi:hypothetical protein